MQLTLCEQQQQKKTKKGEGTQFPSLKGEHENQGTLYLSHQLNTPECVFSLS